MANKPKFTVCGPGPRGKDHTCIMISRTPETVRAIAMYEGVNLGIRVVGIHAKEFDAWFSPSDAWPLEKLAQLYVEYATKLGATQEALDVLGQIITISQEDRKMALAKENSTTSAAPSTKPAAEDGKVKETKPKTTKPAADKTTAEKPAKGGAKAGAAKTTKAAAEKPAKTTEAKAAPKATPAKETKATETKADTKPAKGAAADKANKPSAASRFQELIMAGKLTDDEIFAAVQKEFGLDDGKKSYVKWYRNHLKKAGKNPPEPKAAKK